MMHISNVHGHRKMNGVIKLSSVFLCLRKMSPNKAKKGERRGLEEEAFKIHHYKKSIR